MSIIGKPVQRFLQRYHLTIFTVFILVCLGVAVLFLYRILTDASVDNNYQSPISAGSIDQATLNRINSLHSSDAEYPAAPPASGRINPFSE